MSELGTVERAYADGYAAAQHKIERLRAALEEIKTMPAMKAAWMRAVARDALTNEHNPTQSSGTARAALANEQKP